MCFYWRGNYCKRVAWEVGKLNCVAYEDLRSEIERKSFLFGEICNVNNLWSVS